LWKLTYKRACWTHPNKSHRWIARRYHGRFNQARNDNWVFGDRDTGAYLTKQGGDCPLCGEPLLEADDPPQSPQGWEWWYLRVTRQALRADHLAYHHSSAADRRTCLVHADCKRRNPAAIAGRTLEHST